MSLASRISYQDIKKKTETRTPVIDDDFPRPREFNVSTIGPKKPISKMTAKEMQDYYQMSGAF